MNRRQKKKQFKKKYGMNPKQYEAWLNEKLPKTNAEAVQLAADSIREGFRIFGEAVKEAGRIIGEALKQWAEEAQVAAGFTETENMIRKSNIMPEGADKELLKHIGIRVDRYGWAYDFYYDEANEEYFVEILQEGGEQNGIDVGNTEDVGCGMPDCGGNNCACGTDCLPGSSCEKSERRKIGG